MRTNIYLPSESHTTRRIRRAARCAMAVFAWASAAMLMAAEPASVEDLGINQLQFIGTHNSYHIRMPSKSGNSVREWNYNHAPLDVQLDRGVRSFELDLHDRDGVFEVFHVPILDEGTTCRRLSEALDMVRKWSEAHPRHEPISFLFELKKDGPRLDKRIQEVDAAGLDRLDTLLRVAFPKERLISPDDVRSGAATLRAAVERTGWPTLAASRGKVLFILHDEGKQREAYTHDHPSLRGRAMFVRSDEKRDDGAVLILDNPRSPDIARLVKAGYFIRTRADSDLAPDLGRAVARRDLAFASGAQIVSTDFPNGEPQEDNGYVVTFEGAAPARINPINGPPAWRGKAIEQLGP
jgi:hypothetical protein